MNIPFKKSLLPAMLASVLAGSLAWADDDLPDNDATDTEVVESVEDISSGKFAGYFGDFLGDDAEATIAGLRDGSIHYEAPEDAETDAEADAAEDVVESGEHAEIEGENGEVTSGTGYGAAFITVALAEQMALSSPVTATAEDGTEIEMDASYYLNEVLYRREVLGMGYGQIAKDLGFNLGEVISGYRSNRPDKVESLKAEKMAKTTGADMRAEKAQKVDKVEKVAKLDRPERPMKVERAEKPERPEKPARPERPGR